MTERLWRPVETVNESEEGTFELKCSELLKRGYVLSSSDCGFVQSERRMMSAFDKLHIEIDERLPFLVESTVWEQVITPALNEFGIAMPIMWDAGHHKEVYILLKDLIQSIYVLGYREGAKQKRAPLVLFCPEEEAKGERHGSAALDAPEQNNKSAESERAIGCCDG